MPATLFAVTLRAWTFSKPQTKEFHSHSAPLRTAAFRLFAWIACSLSWSLGSAAMLPRDDAEFLAGLRTRRQFALAATYCRQQLGAAQSTSEQQAGFAVELIRIHTEQAVHASPAQRDQYWLQTEFVAREFAEEHGKSAQAILVEIQIALAHLARGELARIESELAADQERSIEAARNELRLAAQQLEAIDATIATRIGMRAVPGERQGLDRDELRNLQRHVQRQLARALQNQALSYPAGSSDRMAALTESLRQLQKPLAARSVDDPIGRELLLEKAACQRLLGNLTGAQATLASLEGAQSASFLLKLRAEQLRLHIASGDFTKALATIAEGRQIDGETSPEIDFVFLEAFVAHWQEFADRGDADAAQSWRDRAIAAAEFIERNHGPYWARRADLALVDAGQQQGAASVSILARTAADLYVKGQLAEACSVYDKAATSAQQSGDTTAEFELAYKAALIQQQLSQNADASERFRKLAVNSVDPRAHQSHLMAAMNAAEAVRAKHWPVDRYASLLAEHRSRWPDKSTVSTVAAWQGQLREQQQHWQAAVESYQAVVARERAAPTESSDTLTAAISAAARCWHAAINEALPPEQSGLARDAIGFFDQLVFPDAGGERLPTAWTDSALEATFHAAQFRLLYRPADTKIAARLLSESPNPAPHDDGLRQFNKQLTRQLAFGMNATDTELEQQLGEIAISNEQHATAAFNLLNKIAAQTARSATPADGNLIRLQQFLAKWLQSNTFLSAEQRIDVQRLYARALVVRDRQQGLAEWSRLARENTAHRQIQTEYARHLTNPGANPPTLQRGLEQWRRVTKQIPPRSREWYEAKYAVAECLVRLGQREAAAQRIRYLQVTEDLHASGFEKQFAELLKRAAP